MRTSVLALALILFNSLALAGVINSRASRAHPPQQDSATAGQVVSPSAPARPEVRQRERFIGLLLSRQDRAIDVQERSIRNLWSLQKRFVEQIRHPARRHRPGHPAPSPAEITLGRINGLVRLIQSRNNVLISGFERLTFSVDRLAQADPDASSLGGLSRRLQAQRFEVEHFGRPRGSAGFPTGQPPASPVLPGPSFGQ